MKNNNGKIFIAGAGPGDIGLITVKLQSLVSKVDIVLYDHLINKSILSACMDDAVLIPVGKSGIENSKHKFDQDEINKLMIEHVQQGKTVLRLKGGDPFIFGRGSEECEALYKAGIEYEIIPGISSAIAGPIYAGIPLTHRGLSRSLAIATGHLQNGEDANNIKIPDADTIVFVMAVKNLSMIVNKFFEKNYPKETECALIENACSPFQRTFITTLEEVCSVRDNENVSPPALFIVGAVTHLCENLSWFETKPLFGKTFLVTRTQNQALLMSQSLSNFGANVVEYPVIEIKKIEQAKESISNKGFFDTFTDIIFTSVNGIDIFFEYLSSANLDSRALSGKNIIVIGKMSANRLKIHGIKADIIPDTYQAEGILEKLDQDLSERFFLIPRAKRARSLLLDEIQARGGKTEELHLYETVEPKDMKALDDDKYFDGICFTSTSTVANFCKYNSSYKNTKIFAIADITAQSALDNGFVDVITSPEATISALIEKIVEVFHQ